MGPVALTKALLPVDARGRTGPHRAGVQLGRGAGAAGHRTVLGQQGRHGTCGANRWPPRIAPVRARRDDPGDRYATTPTSSPMRAPPTTVNFDGPYARLHQTMNSRGRFAIKFAARPPETVHRRLGEGAGRPRAFRRHGVPVRMRRCCWRPTDCCPSSGMHRMSRAGARAYPGRDAMRGGALRR